MPAIFEIVCQQCGHTWTKSMAELKQYRVVYRNTEPEVNHYSVPCPQCGRHVVITLTSTEAGL